MQNLKDIVLSNPSLIWYSNNTSNLSDESILEHVLNYGTWQQVQQILSTLGSQKTFDLYTKISNKPRTNLKPRVKHYFDLYFSHVSRSSHS